MINHQGLLLHCIDTASAGGATPPPPRPPRRVRPPK
uniref:Uncharacterized protein n=1 Tax=Rhizophora mucronata TaxID=61149 RepID=A0A2P2R377_RHIMU